MRSGSPDRTGAALRQYVDDLDGAVDERRGQSLESRASVEARQLSSQERRPLVHAAEREPQCFAVVGERPHMGVQLAEAVWILVCDGERAGAVRRRC